MSARGQYRPDESVVVDVECRAVLLNDRPISIKSAVVVIADHVKCAGDLQPIARFAGQACFRWVNDDQRLGPCGEGWPKRNGEG